jgi:hypothetical protein
LPGRFRRAKNWYFFLFFGWFFLYLGQFLLQKRFLLFVDNFIQRGVKVRLSNCLRSLINFFV